MARPIMRGDKAGSVFLAFALVYVVWGSTCLAIRIGVREAPPVLFAGLRFLMAASPIILAYAVWHGARLPMSRRDGFVIAATSLLMLVGGNGLVTWSEQWVQSNQAALIVATSALWIAGFGTLGSAGEVIDRATILGLLVVAPMLWAAGSVLARRCPVGSAPVMTAALQILVAGVVQTASGLALGEPARWRWTPGVLGTLLYLAIFGSCIAFGAYCWRVHQVTPAQLATYAYVNPAVAVALGWRVLGERFSAMQLLGTAIILVSVIAVTLASRRRADR
ncbi:MAG: EamA family transporter [Solimonas sp.]